MRIKLKLEIARGVTLSNWATLAMNEGLQTSFAHAIHEV